MKEILKNSWQSFCRFLKKFYVIRWLLVIFLTVTLVASTYFLYVAKTVDISNLKAGLQQATTIYDNQNKPAGQLDSNRGTYVELPQISQSLVDAVISTEDKRFYEHSGVDPIGLARVFVGFFLNGFSISGGGSTLTQQLAKNTFLTQDQTAVRKLQEMFIAKEIERNYTKDDILTMYLNHAYFGYGVWGVEDASKRYFGKSAAQLTAPEAAVLVGMLKSPTYYNPLDYPEYAKNRRDTVLSLMLANNKITQEEFDSYVAMPIAVSDKYQYISNYNYPYYFDAVIAEAVNEYKIEEKDLLSKGYKIYTTLDQTYQNQLDIAYSDSRLFPDATDGTLVQSASVLVDPDTGGVMALIGGRGDHVYRGFSRATQMQRQPGSTLKPLVVYTPALEVGYTPESVVLDEVQSYGADNYTPTNWNNVSVGSLPMYQALAQSKNTSAVWLLDKIGLQTGLDKLHQFGIPTQSDDEYLGIALGGMTQGISPLTLASAYTVFPNKGIRNNAYFITRIEDAQGNVIATKNHTDSYRVTSEKVASDMTRMMLGVYTENGTGRVTLPAGLQIAGKTGTTEFVTSGVQDQWLVAYTPDFVFTTWMGFDVTDENHHLTIDYNNSIYPFGTRAINNILAVSPQTAFSESAIVPQPEPTESIWDTLGSFGNTIKDTAIDLWKGFTDLFNR